MTLYNIFREISASPEMQNRVLKYLEPLKTVHQPTYEHSIRVGDMCLGASRITGFDRVVMTLSGLLHDVGKARLDPDILNKEGPPTEEEWREIEKHPVISHEMIKEDFPNIAEIVKRSHTPQKNGYPVIEVFSPNEIAHVLNIIDFYDALKNRTNSQRKYNGFSSVKQKMLEEKPDQRVLINELYDAGIFS